MGHLFAAKSHMQKRFLGQVLPAGGCGQGQHLPQLPQGIQTKQVQYKEYCNSAFHIFTPNTLPHLQAFVRIGVSAIVPTY